MAELVMVNYEIPEGEPALLAGLDPGIRVLVWFLRSHGFDTTDSGDGVSKDPDPTEVWPAPHVHMQVPNMEFPGARQMSRDTQPVIRATFAITQAQRLHSLLRSEFDISFDPADYDTFGDPFDNACLTPLIQVMFGYPDGVFTLSLFNVHDILLKKGNPNLFRHLVSEMPT